MANDNGLSCMEFPPPTPTSARLDAQPRPFIPAGKHVQQSTGALLHVANALAQVDEQRLAPQLFHLRVEEDAVELAGAGDLAGAQAADECVALPQRQLVARVEREARDRDGRRPVNGRRLETFVRRQLRLPRAGIGAPVAHDRPAVVLAGTDDVELVAAIRAVLALPELAGHGMEREPERVAVTDRIDLRPETLSADER